MREKVLVIRANGEIECEFSGLLRSTFEIVAIGLNIRVKERIGGVLLRGGKKKKEEEKKIRKIQSL